MGSLVTEKFSLEPVEDWVTWDKCVNTSPQGSLFFLSVYLENAGVPSRTWFIRKGSVIRGGLCVQEAAGGEECRLDDLVVHNGLWFLDDKERKATRARDEHFEQRAVAEQLKEFDAELNTAALLGGVERSDLSSPAG